MKEYRKTTEELLDIFLKKFNEFNETEKIDRHVRHV